MLSALLAERERQGNQASASSAAASFGAGKFGGGLVAQIAQMQGHGRLGHRRHRPSARPLRIHSGIRRCCGGGTVDSPQALAEKPFTQGNSPPLKTGLLVAQAEDLDVVVEATGSTSVGANDGQRGHRQRQPPRDGQRRNRRDHRRAAQAQGRQRGRWWYSLVDGDQPGVTMNIIEWAWALGLEVVAAGRGTILFADDPQGTPDNTAARFGFDEETLQRRNISLKMRTTPSATAPKPKSRPRAIANMAGLVPDIRGMHEPSCNLADIPAKIQLGRRRRAC